MPLLGVVEIVPMPKGVACLSPNASGSALPGSRRQVAMLRTSRRCG